MKAKTSQSFFPTDSKHLTKPHCDKYIVMRKANANSSQLNENKEENA